MYVSPGNKLLEVDDRWSSGRFTLSTDFVSGNTYYLKISDRKGAAMAGALFGPLGSLVEDTATEDGKGGTFQLDLVNPELAYNEMAKVGRKNISND